MIIAKTKMKKIPKSCNKCSLSIIRYFDRSCVVTNKVCPQEIKSGGTIVYTRPEWCPLRRLEEKA